MSVILITRNLDEDRIAKVKKVLGKGYKVYGILVTQGCPNGELLNKYDWLPPVIDGNDTEAVSDIVKKLGKTDLSWLHRIDEIDIDTLVESGAPVTPSPPDYDGKNNTSMPELGIEEEGILMPTKMIRIIIDDNGKDETCKKEDLESIQKDIKDIFNNEEVISQFQPITPNKYVSNLATTGLPVGVTAESSKGGKGGKASSIILPILIILIIIAGSYFAYRAFSGKDKLPVKNF